MTAGENLLVACLKNNDSKTLSLIQTKWLDGSEIRQYRFIMEYFRDNGELISYKDFCEKFSLDGKGADSKPSYYLNEIKDRFIFASISDNVPKILRNMKGSPRDGLSELQSLVATLAVDAVDSKDSLYSDDTDKREESYEERERTEGITYLSTGSPDMDALFHGYTKNDLWTIAGKAGQGKSWLMVYLVYCLDIVLREREEKGERWGDILFINNEMGEEELKERFDCVRFKLPYQDFLSGALTGKQKRRYFRGLKNLEKEKSKIRIAYSCSTIDELTTLIGLYNPSAVFIDGSYLMEGQREEGWEKITYLTRNFKRITKNFNVPIVNTTQLKRGSSKSASKFSLDGQDDIAYSSSYSQDSDVAIRMYQDADMRFHDLVGCEVVKGRRVPQGTKILFENNLTTMEQSLTSAKDESAAEPESRTDF